MKEKTEAIKAELEKDLQEVKNLHEVSDLKVKYLGKKGLVTELTSNMKDLSIEEKKEIGKLSNELRALVTEEIAKIENRINNEELEKKLKNEKIDITLPSTKVSIGGANILEKLIEEVEELEEL